MNLKFDGYFDKSFLQTLSLQLPPSGVVGSSSKGGKVGSLIKMECHTSAKIPKRGEEYQSQGSNSRDWAVHLVTELCCPYLGVAIVKH